MHDVKSLELAWKQYKRKKGTPWYILFLLLLAIVLVLFFLKDKKFVHMIDFNTSIEDVTRSHKEEKNMKQSHVHLNGPLLTLERHHEAADVDNNDMLVDLPILNDTVSDMNPVKEERKKEKVHLNIIETSTVTAYEEVEKRFLKSPDIDDALFLAQSYYKKGYYEKAEHWAYEANKLNTSNSESLFIFIKSKVKLGKKNGAISILKNYIEKTNSNEGKTLLRQIEKNAL